MNFFAPVENKAPWLEECTILLTYHGSRAYGTTTDSSDIDIRGVFIPPYDMLVNPFQPPEQYGYHSEEVDFLIFDIRKFIRLASKGNPNIVETLWVEDKSWISRNQLWEYLYNLRHMFITQDLANAYIGYAISELAALRNSLDPRKPKREGRKELVERYGFDTKSAMHSLRISRMCYEVCTQGIVQVQRPDAEELVNIREGRRVLKEIIGEVQENLTKSRELFQDNLPKKVDLIEASRLCEIVISEFLTRD